MKTTSTLVLAVFLTLNAACSDDENNPVSSENNGTNVDSNNGSTESLAAQKLGAGIYQVLFGAFQINASAGAIEFGRNGTEGLTDCTNLYSNEMYGQATFDFEEGSHGSIYKVTASMDGCVAIESGTNAPFEFSKQDLSGDGMAETHSFNGKLAAMTFADDETAPPVAQYDPNTEPTCKNIVFSDVLVETTGLLPDMSGFSNEEKAHNPGGYTEGTITAECGGKKVRCELAGAKYAPALNNLDALAVAKGLYSTCTFE